MGKSEKQYERDFLDLMEYTSFTSTDEIQTKEDLDKFFKEVRSDIRSRGKNNFQITKKFAFSFGEAFQRIAKRGGVTQFNRRQRAIESRPFNSLKEAQVNEATIVQDKKVIYKSSVKVKIKNRIVFRTIWRDSKGRFTKNPTKVKL